MGWSAALHTVVCSWISKCRAFEAWGFNIPSKTFVIVTWLFVLCISLRKSSSHGYHIQVRATAWLQGSGEKSKVSCLLYYLIFIMRHGRRVRPVLPWSLVIFGSISSLPFSPKVNNPSVKGSSHFFWAFNPCSHFLALFTPLEEWATLGTAVELGCSIMQQCSFISVHTSSGHSHAFSRLLCGLHFSFFCPQLIPRKK